jgi:hypothetical protein
VDVRTFIYLNISLNVFSQCFVCQQFVQATSDAKELAGTVSPQVDAGRILSDKAAACHFHIKAFAVFVTDFWSRNGFFRLPKASECKSS